MWVRWGPVGSGGDRLCQTRLIPRSPDGDNNVDIVGNFVKNVNNIDIVALRELHSYTL